MSGLLSGENILASKLAFEDVEVPAWSGVVRMSEMTARKAIEFSDVVEKHPNEGMYTVVVYCACDESGASLFPLPADKDERDAKLVEYIETLSQKSLPILNKLQRAALRVNGMDGGLKNA